jgi:hypothetical protein
VRTGGHYEGLSCRLRMCCVSRRQRICFGKRQQQAGDDALVPRVQGKRIYRVSRQRINRATFVEYLENSLAKKSTGLRLRHPCTTARHSQPPLHAPLQLLVFDCLMAAVIVLPADDSRKRWSCSLNTRERCMGPCGSVAIAVHSSRHVFAYAASEVRCAE